MSMLSVLIDSYILHDAINHVTFPQGREMSKQIIQEICREVLRCEYWLCLIIAVLCVVHQIWALSIVFSSQWRCLHYSSVTSSWVTVTTVRPGTGLRGYQARLGPKDLQAFQGTLVPVDSQVIQVDLGILGCLAWKVMHRLTEDSINTDDSINLCSMYR